MLTINQKKLIKRYKISVLSEINNESLDSIIGKDITTQQIELKRYAEESRLPFLNNRLKELVTEKQKIQNEIAIINDAISTW